MATNKIYAPQVPAVQPAIYEDSNGVINTTFEFSISPYTNENDIKYLVFTLIDPSLKSAYGDNSVLTGSYAYLELGNATSSFDLSLWLSKDLSANKFYQAQFYFSTQEDFSDGVDKNLLSEPSQITLIRVISEVESVVFEQSETNPLSFNTLSGYVKYKDGSNIEAIQNYYFTVENTASEIYTSKTYINDLGSQFKCNFSDCYVYGESKVTFYYTTINGYKGSAEFNITIGISEDIGTREVETILIENNKIKGCVEISIKNLPFEEDESEAELSIQRKTFEKQNWEEIYHFNIKVELEKTTIYWSDFSTDGQTLYEYRFLLKTNKINNYLLSSLDIDGNTVINFKVETDLEDIFLLDKNLQLAARYNPTITGLKYVTQESFINTLGGKFPIFKRNGQVKYKQFTLSGLLYFKENIGEEKSHDSTGAEFTWLDDETESLYFYKDNEINTKLNLLIGRPLATERFVRDTVVNFLCDGKPKLFRSATEGNMIVILSGVTFTPNKTIGSLIYDFSATVTEICESTLENLIKYGIQRDAAEIGKYIYVLNAIDVINETAYVSINSIINNSGIIVTRENILKNGGGN